MKPNGSIVNSKQKLDYIDDLRAMAIIMVIIVHTSQSISNLPYSLQLFTEYCRMGVQLFFVLSAITLCMSLSRVSSNRENLIIFHLKRFFRIAPLYYFGIAFYFVFFCYNKLH